VVVLQEERGGQQLTVGGAVGQQLHRSGGVAGGHLRVIPEHGEVGKDAPGHGRVARYGRQGLLGQGAGLLRRAIRGPGHRGSQQQGLAALLAARPVRHRLGQRIRRAVIAAVEVAAGRADDATAAGVVEVAG
jgi:hypothetical protein